MNTKLLVATAAAITAAEAMKRIDEWFQRGYVMFSDRFTQSTHLRRVENNRPR
jgi:predicted secreted protein